MGDKHYGYYKNTQFCQNPRGDPTIPCLMTPVVSAEK